MKQEITELKNEINNLKTSKDTNCMAPFSYADITSSNKANGGKSQNIPSVVVKPKKQQNSDTTKQDVKTCINPSKLQISVEKIQSTKNGNIIIKCNDIIDTQKLKKYAEETLKDNYEIEETQLKNPQVKIVGYNQEMTISEIEQSIKNQNSSSPKKLFLK